MHFNIVDIALQALCPSLLACGVLVCDNRMANEKEEICMTPKQQQAHDYFYGGYNCAQSVFASFHEEMGLSEETALKLMVSMGGGVGGLREVCGAFAGAAMALNMIQKDIKTSDPDYKQEMYALVQQKAEKFKAQFDTVICRELLEKNDITPSPVAQKRDDKYYEERPCGKYVQYAAGLVEEELQKA